ncbi:MAG: L-threonylcarbamoyladenylate synthase [Bdellovibrionota bacterium]
MTQILQVHEKNPEKRYIKTASSMLESGKIILVPTDTGYCFVGDSAKESSHSNFLALRPSHPKQKPFSLVCKDISQVSHIAQLSTQIFRIATRIWPGPYTLILECNKNTPKVAAGPKRKTVGIRIPSHPILKGLIEEFQNPLLITSVTDEDELIADEYFEHDDQVNSWWTNAKEICARAPKGSLALALENDEPVPLRVSTIVDFSGDSPVLVRDGGWEFDFING